jgi:hypothetical protein
MPARHQRGGARRVHANGAAAVIAVIVVISTARCAGSSRQRWRRRRRVRLIVHAHPGEQLRQQGV